MERRGEAARLVADAARRMEGLLEEVRGHAEAGSFLEAMAVLALVEEGARTNAEGLAPLARGRGGPLAREGRDPGGRLRRCGPVTSARKYGPVRARVRHGRRDQ